MHGIDEDLWERINILRKKTMMRSSENLGIDVASVNISVCVRQFYLHHFEFRKKEEKRYNKEK